MAATVLGKRSRNVIETTDHVVEIPTAKRRTRRAAPAIYEDQDEKCATQSATSKDGLVRSQSTTTRLTRSTRWQATRSRNDGCNDSSPQTTEGIQDLMDLENIPPSLLNTPTTIRYKDCLNVKTPSTPRHRVRPAGLLSTPRSESKTQTPKRTQNVFSMARQRFTQSSSPSKIVGRETERRNLQQFISQASTARRGGCMYVSGPPGTGKSALVQEVFAEFDNVKNLQVSVVNCVSLRTANDVYSKLLHDFSSDSAVAKTNLKQHLSDLFLSKTGDKMRLVLLDEIDNLLDIDCEVLYTIFEWAMHKSSSIILVGIANALDLTDRFLPRLKARGLKPNLLPFLPYTAAQISTIITNKLRSLLQNDTTASSDFIPLMQPAAVQLCGKKIASQTGDLRRAFSLVQRIIEQVEKETLAKNMISSPSKQPLGEISNLAGLITPTVSPLKSASTLIMSFTMETAPRATIAHAAKMASSIFNNGTQSRLNGLNLQQKAVLCSLVGGEKRRMERNPFITPSKSVNKTPSVKELFIKYTFLCKRDEGLLHPLKDTEFRDVVASLETLGLVHEQKGRSSSLLTPTNTPSRSGRSSDDAQIVSAVSEREMRESLNGAGADLLRRLLDEE